MPVMRYLAAIALLLLLAACATLSEDECRSADWYQIGREDGANGRKLDFILQHAKACNEFGIKPIASEWRKGREEGLKLYCTRENAYRVGTRGHILSAVCPAEGLSQLERANERGLRYNRIRQEMSEIQNEISQLGVEISRLPAGDPSRAALISERSFLRLELLSLRTELARYRY